MISTLIKGGNMAQEAFKGLITLIRNKPFFVENVYTHKEEFNSGDIYAHKIMRSPKSQAYEEGKDVFLCEDDEYYYSLIETRLLQ